jgi:hypothetical protein
MAKGVKRILGVSSRASDYDEPSQLPWPEIEKTRGRPIPDAHRVKIFKARENYFGMRAAYIGVPLEHVKQLRRRLCTLCREICRIKKSADDAYKNRAIDGDVECAQKLLGTAQARVILIGPLTVWSGNLAAM